MGACVRGGCRGSGMRGMGHGGREKTKVCGKKTLDAGLGYVVDADTVHLRRRIRTSRPVRVGSRGAAGGQKVVGDGSGRAS